MSSIFFFKKKIKIVHWVNLLVYRFLHCLIPVCHIPCFPYQLDFGKIPLSLTKVLDCIWPWIPFGSLWALRASVSTIALLLEWSLFFCCSSTWVLDKKKLCCLFVVCSLLWSKFEIMEVWLIQPCSREWDDEWWMMVDGWWMTDDWWWMMDDGL